MIVRSRDRRCRLVEGDKLPLKFGAQDVSVHASGACTGESRPTYGQAQLRVRRRQPRAARVPDETDSDRCENKERLRCWDDPDLLRRVLDIRKGTHVPFVLGQVEACLDGLTAEQVAAMVIAYEPVWAIGTGEVATPEDAQEVCEAIRGYVTETFGAEAGEAVRIQYGGSVKANNIVEIMAKPDVDGALVGGASLNAEEFAKIVLYYSSAS